MLLFLLLAIPVFVFALSQSGMSFSNLSFARKNVGDGMVVTSKRAAQGNTIPNQPGNSAKVIEGGAKVQPYRQGDSSGKSSGIAKSNNGGSNASPTATPLPIQQRCNTGCTSDKACGDGMVCTQVNGQGKCRNAECFGIEDCWCYKVTSPSPAKACNSACSADADCGKDMVCIQDSDGTKKCRNPQCYGVTDCTCFKITSPTPTPSCNGTCTTDTDCGASMICVKTASGNKCRNPQCYGTEDCLCYTVTSPTVTPTTPPQAPIGGYDGGEEPTPRVITRVITATPTIGYEPLPTATPTPPSMLLADLLQPTGAPVNPLLAQVTATPPSLTIDPFYNAKKQTNTTFLLTGRTDPEADLTVTISPDAFMGAAKADVLGNWQVPVTKQLGNGDKQLTVIAKTAKGGVTTKTDTFSVAGGFQFPMAAVVFSVAIAALVGGYLLYHKMKEKKEPPSNPVQPQPSVSPDIQKPA